MVRIFFEVKWKYGDIECGSMSLDDYQYEFKNRHNNKCIASFEMNNCYELQLNYHTSDQNYQQNVILLNHQMTQFFDVFVIIIAVMQLRREPYLLKFKKDNEAIVAKKIKELQMAAEQQKKQVKSLLIEQPPLVPQRDIQVSTSARTNKGGPIQSTKTARKRPKCEDYVDRQPMPNGADAYNNAEEQQARPPLPLIVIPGKETKEDDKEFEYLKSEEYKKYLERLTQGHSKEDKVKIIKQNRNNNVYLGKAGMMDRKQYIQEIIRTKEVLPRVNLPFLRGNTEGQLQKQQQNHQSDWRGQIVDSLVFNENPQPKSVKKPALENNKRQILQESPIRYAQQQFSVPSNRQKQSNNVTIILSPVSQNHDRQPQKQQKQYKQQKQQKYQREQQRRQQKQYKKLKQNKDQHEQKQIAFLSYHNQKSKPNTAKQAELPKPNIILHQQKSKPIQTKAIKCETYRKQFEYCQKINYHATQRDVNKRQKSKSQSQKKYSCKFMMDEGNKKSYERKRSPQSSLCSSPSFKQKRQSQNCIYDICFKIDKPSTSRKETYYQPHKKENPNTYSLNRYSPNPNYHKTPEKSSIIKHAQPRQRLFTEISNNYYPLQSSQTNSAITRQDTSSHTRSPHKISVISRSKHRK